MLSQPVTGVNDFLPWSSPSPNLIVQPGASWKAEKGFFRWLQFKKLDIYLKRFTNMNQWRGAMPRF